MDLNLTIAIFNTLLFVVLMNRLKIFHLGIFSLGFFNLFTAFFPHFVLTPLLAITGSGSSYNLLGAKGLDFSSPSFYQALFLVTLILVGLIIGSFLPKRTDVPFFNRFKSNLPFKYPLLLILMFIFFGGIPILIKGYFLGSYNPLVLATLARVNAFDVYYIKYNLSYPLNFASAGFLFCHALLTIYALHEIRGKKGLFLAITVCLFSILVLMVSGSRSLLLSAPIISGFLIHHYFRKIPFTVILIGASLALFVIPLYKLLAHGNTLQSLIEEGQLTNTSNIANGLQQRFGNFQVMVRFLDWFQVQDLALGTTMLSLVFRPFPRALIPWKPPSNDIFFTREIYGQDAAIQIHGGWAEVMYNFWIPGVLLWFIFLGYILTRFQFGFRKLLKNQQHIAVAMIISNFSFLRGLPNLGMNTISTQNMIMGLVTQLLILISIRFYHHLTTIK